MTFLELLDDVTLLATFNGSSFDVPRILDAFHIPELPCPHVDLRWMCHHQGWKGGLKDIAEALGITRPADLVQADGALAIRLWHLWTGRRDRPAREQLLRYCGADVLLLLMLVQHLIGVTGDGSLFPAANNPAIICETILRPEKDSRPL